MIGEGQSGVAELHGTMDERFGRGGAVQKRERGVGVEFDVHDGRTAEKRQGRQNVTAQLPFCRPCRRCRSRFLHEPLTGSQIFEEHHVPTSFEDDLDVAAVDGGAPPFVLHRPGFEDFFHYPAAVPSGSLSTLPLRPGGNPILSLPSSRGSVADGPS